METYKADILINKGFLFNGLLRFAEGFRGYQRVKKRDIEEEI